VPGGILSRRSSRAPGDIRSEIGMRSGCGGDMLSAMNQTDRQMERLAAALKAAAENEFDIDVNGLAELAGYSAGHFQRVFRRCIGISPGRFLRHARID